VRTAGRVASKNSLPNCCVASREVATEGFFLVGTQQPAVKKIKKKNKKKNKKKIKNGSLRSTFFLIFFIFLFIFLWLNSYRGSA
jgi:hypothetical protein